MICNEQRPYIFISYAHKDSSTVLAIINDLIAAGYNVWWDEGIDPGTEWDENIALHVKGCGYFVAFVSNNYIASKNCKDELNYSRDLDKNQLLVYLEDVVLPEGMAMRMNRIQSIFWAKYPNRQDAFEKLCSAKGIEIAKLSDEAPAGWKPAEVPAASTQSGSSGSKNMTPFIMGGVAAVAVIVIVVVLVFGGKGKDDGSGLTESPTTVVATDSQTDSTADKGGDLELEATDSSDYSTDDEKVTKYYSFGSSYTRDQVSSVTFCSTLPTREDKGLDVSVDKDGSVLAWFDQNGGGLYDLTIAADGKIRFPEDCGGMFWGYSNVQSVEFNDAIDTGNVKITNRMFRKCYALRRLDVSCFENAQLTNIGGWFQECAALTELNGLDKLDTSQVGSMWCVFAGCKNLKQIDVSGFDTSSTYDMLGMFYICQAVEKLDVSGFDTSNVKNMSLMFYQCQSVEELDVSGFDISNVASIHSMFYGCQSVKTLDVSGFDTSNVADFHHVFLDTKSLKQLDLSNWSFERANDEEYMKEIFYGMQSGVKIFINKNELEKIRSFDSALDGAPEDIEFITE